MISFATYVHDLSPYIFKIGDRFGLHWYGLSYILGFLAGYLVLRLLIHKGIFELPAEKLADFITYAAIFGVVLGGRIGYCLFYQPNLLIEFDASFPFWGFLKLHEGGMASHGGILGLIVFTYFYAKKNGMSWFGVGDNLVVAAPLGIFFGRCANFINGELYGRPTDVAWAVKFPRALERPQINETVIAWREKINFIGDESLIKLSDRTLLPSDAASMVEVARQDETYKNFLAEYLQARHPSQIYEAVLEGLLLFIVLFVIRLKYPNLKHGILTGLFFILYAVGRIYVEQFRVPDSALIGFLTKGQFYSIFMIFIGVAFILLAKRKPILLAKS